MTADRPKAETTKDELLARLATFGQEHVLRFWDELDDQRRAALAEQIRALDLGLIDRLYRERNRAGDVCAWADRVTLPPAFRLDDRDSRFAPPQARRCGQEALRAGRVGMILVAGGQGTRLGFDHPKGMFPIGPVSGHSLLQIHLEKIVAAGQRHGIPIPLYLMTSPATHEETVGFLEKHDRFGLQAEDLFVFCQGTMPAVDAETGEILLAERGRVSASPDGHGGMLAALAGSSALNDIERRGIEQLFYFQVDNPLVDVPGPELIGYHVLCGSEMSTQVIAKRDPLEKVGNVVQVDGKLRIVEYSDLPDEMALRRAADGTPLIWAGSIAVHVFRREFLARMADRCDAMPFHMALKNVPYVDRAGQLAEPQQPNAIKFERFIFDLLPAAAAAIVVEVDRARGFAPLKNASGAAEDTPETVRQQIVALHRQWLEQAGAEVAEGVAVEISPLFALDEQQLAERITPGTQVTEPTFFC